MMTKKLLLTFLAFAFVVKSQVRAQDRNCSAFTSSPAASVSFLKEQVDIRESPCITTVIEQLGRTRSTEAIAVLIPYLDFVDPATAPHADGFADKRTDYPAIGALFLVGKAATADLVSAIQNSESPIIRRNAARAYQAVYRDNLALGIHILRTSELVPASPEHKNRLREVKEMLAEDCAHRSEEEALACKTAVDGK